MDSKSIKQFAKLILKFGVNLQNGQCFELSCPVTEYKVARIFIDTAYEMGAKYARVRWNDEKVDASTYLNADEKELTNVPKWLILSKNELVEKNFCYVAIAAEDPYAFKGVPEDKIARIAKARSKALKKFSDTVMANGIRWCVVSVPTLQWAKSVFPNSKKPEKDLWQEIFKTMRLDCDNPEQQWQEHVDKLIRHANQLNDFNFDYLHFANSLGTDLKIGLADNHVWLSALEKAKDGVNFIANMPTEEVFTAPHRLKADGKLYSAMPLVYNGNIIDKFSLTFSLLTISDTSESERGSESRRNRGSNTSYSSHSESHFEDVGDSINTILSEIGGGGTMAAEGLSSYSTEAPEESVLEQNIDALIAEMKSKMESAAKTLDFQNAARYRDRMYELQKLRDNLKK